MSGLPSGNWKRKGILAVRLPATAPVVDSTEITCAARPNPSASPLSVANSGKEPARPGGIQTEFPIEQDLLRGKGARKNLVAS